MIVLEKINKKYGNHEIIHDFSLNIKDNEFLAIYGKSGSGKTTILNIIGLIDGFEGKYFLNDVDVSLLAEKELAKIRNQFFGYIFQNYYLDEDYSVYQNCQIPVLLSRNSVKNLREKVFDSLRRLGIEDKIDEKCASLSGGEAQRVAIARALINNPKIILADEPCGALDSKNSKEVMEILAELHRLGKTIILVTHNEHDAQYATRKITISDGAIINDERI